MAGRLRAEGSKRPATTILKPADIDSWLRGSYDEIVALQRPYDPAKMTVRGPVFPTCRDER